MKKSYLSSTFKKIIVVSILIATFAVFIWYLWTNPETISTVLSVPPEILLVMLLGYIGMILANAVNLRYSLRLIEKNIPMKEGVLLTGYSSIVNFFGPLQSGPGARAVYLKTKHNVPLKKFFIVSVIFYSFYAAINSAILASTLVATAKYSLTQSLLVLGVAVLIFTSLLFAFIRKKRLGKFTQLNNKNFWMIGASALLLIFFTSVTYFAELYYLDPKISLVQALGYTAAANLTLFVAITPGAIGFREGFLVITQSIHTIPNDVIIAANIIDRAFYVIFLLFLFSTLLLVSNKFSFRPSMKEVE